VKREATKRPEAVEDLYAQARYYADEGSAETAVRFLAAAERTFAQLVMMPEMGAARAYRNSSSRAFACGGSGAFVNT
jgi:plasmid stabilization system protein ParE